MAATHPERVASLVLMAAACPGRVRRRPGREGGHPGLHRAELEHRSGPRRLRPEPAGPGRRPGPPGPLSSATAAPRRSPGRSCGAPSRATSPTSSPASPCPPWWCTPNGTRWCRSPTAGSTQSSIPGAVFAPLDLDIHGSWRPADYDLSLVRHPGVPDRRGTPARSSRWTACCPPSCSPTSPTPPSWPQRWAMPAGGSCSTATTGRPPRRSPVTAGSWSSRPATGSWPASTARAGR